MDRKIPSKYSIPYFLTDRSIQQAGERGINGVTDTDKHLTMPYVEGGGDTGATSYPKLDNPTAKNAMVRANDDALKQLLLKRNKHIDEYYGPKATEWIVQNFDQFDPEQRLQLYYVLNKMPDSMLLKNVNTNKVATPPEHQPRKIYEGKGNLIGRRG